jgi:two-component system, OmpR family, sensor histidine kinase KdpD
MRRKTPEELLREVQSEGPVRRGHLKVFLGYASGVGKSFRMLDEARRRRERGQDVIVGGVQPKFPPEVEALLPRLEIIPLRSLEGATAIDVEAIIRRNPAVCFIDGLAYDNPPGSRNRTRWQDVQELVNAGMKVVGSINIQYIDELREQVEAVTGKRVMQAVPVSFIKSADEIEIVDAPSEEPLERSPEDQASADQRQQRLCRLRELALVLAADVVDHQLVEYLNRQGIKQHFSAQERILLCMTPRANAKEMLDTAGVIAQKFHAEITAIYIRQTGLSAAAEAAIKEKLDLARAAGATVEILDSDDPAGAILEFARQRAVTQIFVGHSQQTGSRFRTVPVEKLIRGSRNLDVRIFPQ